MSVTINHQTNSVEPSSGNLLIGGSGNVGIGTTAGPSANLDVKGSTSNQLRLRTADTEHYAIGRNASTGFLDFYGSQASYTGYTFGGVDGERMRITSGGYIEAAGASQVRLTLGSQGTAGTNDANWLRGNGTSLGFNSASGGFQWEIAGSEKMRIDSSGNLLVGTTSANAAVGNVTGHSIKAGGLAEHSNDAVVMRLNRKSSDGDILEFRKDGSTVGSISCGSSGAYIYFGSSAESVGLGYGGGFVFPTNGATSGSDNAKDLGSPSFRWDDIYATNPNINTSDRNEKQDVAELSEAEQRVAVACKGLLRKFRWKSAVAEKGDEARTHFGIIAQDLQTAFAAEGLDAGRYAMFISTTWWEHDVEVPAIEAVAEVLDDDGNVVTEAVEAADAYTRTDTYDTQEKAPEGATERTRLGVRYSELLAFIIAAI
ncbi:tail fiber domain-containing protein [bacterium]|nr:tail fiber domain-containing protein [bacterium]